MCGCRLRNWRDLSVPVWGDQSQGRVHPHASPSGGPCTLPPVPLHNPAQVLEPLPWGQLHTLGPTPSSECLDDFHLTKHTYSLVLLEKLHILVGHSRHLGNMKCSISSQTLLQDSLIAICSWSCLSCCLLPRYAALCNGFAAEQLSCTADTNQKYCKSCDAALIKQDYTDQQSNIA